MRYSKIIISITGIIFSFGLSCGKSPLTNKKESSSNTSTTSTATRRTEENACPLFFTKALLCVQVEWVKAKPEEPPRALVVKFWEKANGSSTGPYIKPKQKLNVELWMPEHGHGSSPTKVSSQEQNAEVFVVSDIYFSMPGKWEVRIQLLEHNGDVFDQMVLEEQI